MFPIIKYNIHYFYCRTLMNTKKNLSDTHILKIVLKGKTFNSDVGIKCSPRQTYGVSQQSPDNFKLPHGLIGQNGYLYQDEQDRKDKDKYFPYFNQRKFCSVIGNTIDVVQNSRQAYLQQYNKSPKRFHKRKGRLTEFMDKNGWMNNVYQMMGYQRSSEARQLLKRDIDSKIRSARRPNIYINPVEKRISVPKESYINPELITEKAKIRLERLSIQNQKRKALDIQKKMQVSSKKSPQKDMYIDAENLTNNMSSTKNEKQWRSTMATIRKKFRKQIDKQDKMSLTKSDWGVNNYSTELKPQTSYNNRQLADNYKVLEKYELKQWFNTTCNTNADPWKYRKAQKVTSISDQQAVNQ